MTDERKTILVLSERADLYRPLVDAIGKESVCVPTAKLMVSQLLNDHALLGVILDVKTVMDSDPDTRDKLFKLADKLPIVRSHVLAGAKKPTLLDPIELLTNADTSRQRSEPRSKVRLESVWAADADPAMIETHEAVILNLSSSGAFLHTPNVLPNEDYIHLKVLEMRLQRPIHCAVRWRRHTPAMAQYVGVGIQFLDLTDKQLEELSSKHLG